MADFTSDEVFKNWEKTGKYDFVKLMKKEALAKTDFFLTNVNRGLYELCWQILTGKLKIESVVTTIGELLVLDAEVSSILAEVLGVIDSETICNSESELQDSSTHRDKFVAFVTALSGFESEGLLKERLEFDTLEAVGLLQSKLVFVQRYVKTKTRLYYKQQKFNLLREESEGYSKLITELLQEIPQPADDDDTSASHQCLNNVKALIGCFNLDPNRVLDIILEGFECQPCRADFFIPLVKYYTEDREALCHILGFKFHFYQKTDDEVTPKSLYQISALLIYHGLVDMETLLPHLIPLESEIIEQHKKEVADAKVMVQKMNVVSVGEKPKEETEDSMKSARNTTNNQKLGLLEALLNIGSWKYAQDLLNHLPPFYATSQQPIAQAMCNLIAHLLDPVYIKFSGLPQGLVKKRTTTALPKPFYAKQSEQFADLQKEVFPMLHFLGPHIYCNINVIVKLLRLAKAYMNQKMKSEEKSEEFASVYYNWLTVVDENLLPSLNMHPANCGLSEEIWSFLKLFPYDLRYRLYGNWKNETYKTHQILLQVHAGVKERARYIMKRLAKENVKQLGRQIGKLSHSNPGVLFEFVLSQIQKYDNFILPVVDSLKFLTPLSFDVLAFCIIEALANPAKERMKHDDTNISLWLQSLANFSGAVFKKYQIDLVGLLQYVVNQLKAKKSYDLLILREVVQKMAGIEVSEEITEDQLQAMSGGDLLKQEGGQYSQVRNTKRSSNRLRESLLENNLAVPLVLMMATQQNSIIFTPTSYTIEGDPRPLKLVGKLYDQCHDTFVQFASFLGMQLTGDELEKRLPSIDALLDTYQLPSEAAFALVRPIFNGRIMVKYEELRKLDKKDKEKQTAPAKAQRYFEASEQELAPVLELMRPLATSGMWEDLTPRFYVTFWTLTMSDLHTPTAAYEKQVLQLKQQVLEIEENKDMNQSKKKKEKDRCISLIEKVNDEERKQNEHANRILYRLKHEKDSWFQSSKANRQLTVNTFIQSCLFPRMCFTAIDAIYSAKFLCLLHSLKTHNFSSLICYDRILSDIVWPMTSCTENEAHRYGRFINAIFDDIMRWHSEKAVYEKECSNYPGFKTVFRNAGTKDNNSVADQLDYENFRHLCYKWHYQMTKVFMTCMDSKDYIQIRNALIVLTRTIQHFPRVSKFGQALEKNVEKMCQEQKEKLPDMFALATGYLGQLKARKKHWLLESDFHISKKQQNAAPSRAQAKSDTDGKKEPSAQSSSSRTAQEKKSETDIADSSVNGDKVSGGTTSSKAIKLDREHRKESRQAEEKSSKQIEANSEQTKEKSKAKDEVAKETSSRDEPEAKRSRRDDGGSSANLASSSSKSKTTGESRSSTKEGKTSSSKKDKTQATPSSKDRTTPSVKESTAASHHHRSSSTGVESEGTPSGQRRTMEAAVVNSAERESKRRKVENTNAAKSTRHEKTKEQPKTKDKGDRKRDAPAAETSPQESKKAKLEDKHGHSKANGSTNEYSSHRSKSLERLREKGDGEGLKSSPKLNDSHSHKNSPERSKTEVDRERRSDKHTLKKKRL